MVKTPATGGSEKTELLTSAPCRSEGADRRCGGSGEGADSAGQGPALRPLRRRLPKTIRRAHAVHPVTAVPVRILAVDEIFRRRIGFVPWSPLGLGIPHRESRCPDDLRQELGSPRTSPRASLRRLGKANQAGNQSFFSAIAKRKKATPGSDRARLAACARSRGIVPIPGTRKLERMVENIGAAEDPTHVR